MQLSIYHVDAFADRPFEGNPAAVVPLERWLPDGTLQAIATENNLSETAFYLPRGGDFELRWFTPTQEIDLCGHATLATAHVLFEERGHRGERIRFHTSSGWLAVARRGGLLELDFPSQPATARADDGSLARALGRAPRAVERSGNKDLALFDSEREVRALAPDFRALARLEPLGVIASARGEEVDFVSRFFAPKAGVDEDPVTGSAHCVLIPHWARALGKDTLRARQVSRRGGTLFCELRGERVGIAGGARTYLVGGIAIP
jgi:PhzF family phenazine biosynthesis protein